MRPEKDITFFIGPFGSGGGERNCCNIANAFARKGISVTVVAIGVKDPIYLKRFDSRVRFVDLNEKHLRHAFYKIFRFLQKERPSKVLAFNHYLGAGLEILRFFPQFNYELYMRNIVGLTKKYRMNTSFWQTKISKPVVEIMLRRLNGVVSQCVAMKEDLTKYWHISPQKIRVIYNPVAEEVENNISPYSRSGKDREILFVGRFSAEKGISVLIRSFKVLSARYPDLKLRLLGEGPLETELKELVATLELQDKVIFQGFVRDTIPYYKKALVTALPSFSEGFPNVLIESISLGTPVVAFDCETGPSEIIREGINGYLVGLGDETEFTHALDKALKENWNFMVEEYRQAPIISQYLSFLKLDNA